jgi:hypothetical protein
MDLRPTQGNLKMPQFGIHSLWNRYPFLVIPTEAKRSGETCGFSWGSHTHSVAPALFLCQVCVAEAIQFGRFDSFALTGF